MPSKYQIVSEMAAREAAQISSGARSYMDFLETAASNYKYSFREQLLIHNQKPDATACAEIGTWNKLGRWVNKGTKGIALLVDNQEKYKVRYVFDVSDTNSFRGYEIYLWKLQPRFEDRVMVALEDRFGALDEHTGFSNDILTLVNAIVEDNLTDYAELLRTVKDGSLLEELDELNTDMWLRSTVKSSVAFIVLTRCGYDARQLFAEEDFSRVYDFSTLETVSVLGDASSDISEMVLREIEITVRALQREEKTQNHTFANSGRSRDNVRTITERSDEHGNDTDISAGGRLSPTQRSPAGEPEGGQIWDAAARLPARPPKADLHRDAPSRQVKQPFGDDRPAGDGDDGNADRANGESGERDGASESIGSDALGPVNEQHSEPGGGDSSSRSDLQLIDIEAAIHSGIDYFHQDAEKQELLRTCDELKGHRVEIAAFFEAHESSKERGDFIRSFFDSTFVEQILETGQRVGHRAYANCMNLWRGAYLSREAESFMHWEGIAATINGMILMRQWLDPDERQLPSQAEQLSFLQDELDENETEFVMPQEAIDYVLTGGSGVHEGKYRILEQFEKGESSEDNIKFLKAEYGVGGHSDAIPGTGIWEDHDSKGITLKRILKSDDKRDTLLLKWPRVEKRIRELIAADRYLNAAEKAEYPDYLHRREVRSERILIAKAFEEIIAEYRNSAKENGKEDVLDAKWYLSACASAFATGEKKIHVRTGEGDFILPIMREAIQAIAAEKTPLTERCEVMLNELSGPLAMGLEPTEEELNPPPPPKVEYRISLGDAVYIGSKQFEVLSLGDNVVEVSEADYPLFHKEFVRSEFDHMVAENPLNDRYRHIVEEPEIESYTPLDDDGRYTIHSMSSPGQKDEFAVFDEQTGDFVVGSDSLIHSFQTIREAYDYYRAIIADHIEEKPAEQQYEIGYGHMGNGLTVWNRLETENGDYKTVAHIDLDRKVTFYDAGLPDEIKAAILNVAQTSDMSISATQDAPVFATPAQELELGNEMWQDYNRIRGEQNGAVVLYQVGDFYEVLGEDARTVAEALDLTMTTRNVGLKERVPMCGIPAKMLETSIYLINDRSFDVVVVESTGNISVLVSTHKITPIVSRPVGRVDYLGTNGDVAYSIEYTEEQRLVRDILDDNHNGVPMSIVVYRDKDGNTISQDFIGQLDPAPQGFEVIDYKKARPETSLDRAKRLINEYSQREFESDADFSDLTSVGIAYTMTEDEDMPLEAVADLINCRINRYVNGKLVDCQEYDSLEDMIHIELEYMDFNDLVSFTDEQIAEARDRADTEDHSQLEIDKETSTENSDVQRAPFGVEARTEEFEHVELFDISMLLTEARISPDTVPVGWFC